MVRLVYARSRTLGGWLIRAAQWWFPASHVAIETRDGTLIHAVAGRGVVEDEPGMFFGAYTVVDIVEVLDVDEAAAVAFARNQIGSGYDYKALLRFISKALGREDARRWQCVELVEAALEAGGRRRFRTPLSRVTVRQSYQAA